MFKEKRTTCLFFVIILSFQFAYNQDISLSYSIQWKEKELYLLNYDKPEIPFLCLKYENIGKDSIYIYSGTDEIENFLNINYHTGFMINVKIEDEWKKIHDSLPDWSEKEYKIYSLNNYSREFMVSLLPLVVTVGSGGKNFIRARLWNLRTCMVMMDNKELPVSGKVVVEGRAYLCRRS